MTQAYEFDQKERHVGSFEEWLASKEHNKTKSRVGQTHAREELKGRDLSTQDLQHRTYKPKLARSNSPIALDELSPAPKSQPLFEPQPKRVLHEVPTGPQYRARRREIKARRAVLFLSATVVCLAGIVSVVARAEIAKMSLAIDRLTPTIDALHKANYQLSLQEQALSSPARIAQYTQSHLNMVFPTTSYEPSTASSNLMASAKGSPYGLYYTPSGSPTTTVAIATNTTSARTIKKSVNNGAVTTPSTPPTTAVGVLANTTGSAPGSAG